MVVELSDTDRNVGKYWEKTHCGFWSFQAIYWQSEKCKISPAFSFKLEFIYYQFTLTETTPTLPTHRRPFSSSLRHLWISCIDTGLRQSCWFSVVKYTSTRMYCVKVIFLFWYSTPPTLCSPPPQALVWPGEPAWGSGGDIQEEAGGSGRPAQTGAPPGGAQHGVHAAHLRAGRGAP